MKKILFTILLITPLILAGCIAEKPAAQQPIANENTNVSTSTADIDTSDWKTYRNNKYRFNLMYPANYVITTDYGVSKDLDILDGVLISGEGKNADIWVQVLNLPSSELKNFILSLFNPPKVDFIEASRKKANVIVGNEGEDSQFEFQGIGTNIKNGMLLKSSARAAFFIGPTFLLAIWTASPINESAWNLVYRSVAFGD